MISAQNLPNTDLKQQYHRDIAPFTSPLKYNNEFPPLKLHIFLKPGNLLKIKLIDVITVIQEL